MLNIKPLRLFLSFLLVICVYGCVGVNKYFVSRPAIDADEIRVTQDGEIKLDGATIVIRPANAILKSSSEGLFFPFMHYEPEEYSFNSSYYNNGSLSPANFFILEVIVSPARNDFVFTPKAVTLRTHEGGEIFPVSYKKLTTQRGWYSIYYPRYVSSLCHEEGGEKNIRIDQPLLLSGENDSCLAIKYDVSPPDPRANFAIHMKGLKINGKDVNVPIIKFVPGIHRYQRS